jgi:hypothetical protein
MKALQRWWRRWRESAVCPWCGKRRRRDEMVRVPGVGWFCGKEHATEHKIWEQAW